MSNLMGAAFAFSVASLSSMATVGLYTYYDSRYEINIPTRNSETEPVNEAKAAYEKFAITDATEMCKHEMESIFEDDLLTSSVDWHSTRYDEARNKHVVVMKIVTGTWQKTRKGNAYCYIDETRKLTYTSSVDDDNKMMRGGVNFSKTMGFSK